MDFYELLLNIAITLAVVTGIIFIIWLKDAIDFERLIVVMTLVLLAVLAGIAGLK